MFILVALRLCAGRRETAKLEVDHLLVAVARRGVEGAESLDVCRGLPNFLVTFPPGGGFRVLPGFQSAGWELPDPAIDREPKLVHEDDVRGIRHRQQDHGRRMANDFHVYFAAVREAYTLDTDREDASLECCSARQGDGRSWGHYLGSMTNMKNTRHVVVIVCLNAAGYVAR